MAHTSGCVSRRSGTRSTVAASGRSPRCANPCSMRGRRPASRPMRRHGSQSPQKSSGSRSQFAACANMRASVNFPTPRGPENSIACGTRSADSMPRSAATTRGLPWNSEKLKEVLSKSSSGGRLGENSLFYRANDSAMNLLWRIQRAGPGVGTVDAHPGGPSCQTIVN